MLIKDICGSPRREPTTWATLANNGNHLFVAVLQVADQVSDAVPTDVAVIAGFDKV